MSASQSHVARVICGALAALAITTAVLLQVNSSYNRENTANKIFLFFYSYHKSVACHQFFFFIFSTDYANVNMAATHLFALLYFESLLLLPWLFLRFYDTTINNCCLLTFLSAFVVIFFFFFVFATP